MLNPESAEFLALAQLADVEPARMAAAFSDPQNLFEHISPDELTRIRDAGTRFGELANEIARSLGVLAAYMKGFLAAHKSE